MPNQNLSILLIEDDTALAPEAEATFRSEDYVFQAVRDRSAAIAAIRASDPNIIIMNQSRIRPYSASYIAEFRRLTQAAIVMLAEAQSEADRIIALEMGADSFLEKPISSRELLARVRAIARREIARSGPPSNWRIDAHARRLHSPQGVCVALTATEFNLLFALLPHVGQPVSRDELSQLVLGRRHLSDDRSLDNLIYQIRTKIRDAGGGDVITVARGKGYFFTGFPSPLIG